MVASPDRNRHPFGPVARLPFALWAQRDRCLMRPVGVGCCNLVIDLFVRRVRRCNAVTRTRRHRRTPQGHLRAGPQPRPVHVLRVLTAHCQSLLIASCWTACLAELAACLFAEVSLEEASDSDLRSVLQQACAYRILQVSAVGYQGVDQGCESLDGGLWRSLEVRQSARGEKLKDL